MSCSLRVVQLAVRRTSIPFIKKGSQHYVEKIQPPLSNLVWISTEITKRENF
jgi:hypothetical protein